MASRIDWIKLKKEFILGEHVSLREFAEKQGLKYNGHYMQVTKGWCDERDAAKEKQSCKIIEKTIEKVAEIEAKKEVDRNTKTLKLIDKVLESLETVLSGELKKHVDMFGNVHDSEVIKVDKLEAAMRALEKAQKAHRLAEGLTTENTNNINHNIESSGFDLTTQAGRDAYMKFLAQKHGIDV